MFVKTLVTFIELWQLVRLSSIGKKTLVLRILCKSRYGEENKEHAKRTAMTLGLNTLMVSNIDSSFYFCGQPQGKVLTYLGQNFVKKDAIHPSIPFLIETHTKDLPRDFANSTKHFLASLK